MINILTKGSILRTFVVLIWVAAIAFRYYVAEPQRVFGILMLIAFVNMFLYMAVISMVEQFAKNSITTLLPDYFTQLKKALISIFLVSLMPTLLLLPNLIIWLSSISISILMATIIISMTLNNKILWGWVGLTALFANMPSLIQFLPSWVIEINFYLVFALALPVVIFWAYRSLNKLQHYNVEGKPILGLTTNKNLNINDTMTRQDESLLESRNSFIQWLRNKSQSYSLYLIHSGRNMSNTQLLTVACQNLSSISGRSYWVYGIAMALFSFWSNYFGNEYLSTLLVNIGFILMMSVSALHLNQRVNSKKSLLKRLSIMPCFNGKDSFPLTFITYISSEKLKLFFLYSFLLIIFYSISHNTTLDVFLSILMMGLSLCLLNLTVMFWAWSSKHNLDSLVLSLLIVAFIAFTALLTGIVSDKIMLWQYPKFIIFALICISLFSVSIFRCYNSALKEL